MRFFIRRTAGSLRTSAPIVEASGPLVDSATVWAGASATLADICADLDDELGNISAAGEQNPPDGCWGSFLS
jgi:hypothetical protein